MDSFSKNYYISNSGDDNNDGLTPQTAWRTLAKIEKEMASFMPGDFISFKGGEIFQGKLSFNDIKGTTGNPITFNSFGNGRAIITGSTGISAWKRESGNIWSTAVDHEVYQVFSKNDQLINARTGKNEEFYSISSVSNKKRTFRVNSLIGHPDLSGATVQIRVVPWRIAQGVISSFNSSTGEITLVSDIDYTIEEGEDIFICNHYSLLDSDNEWFSDKNKLYVYSTIEPSNISAIIDDIDSGIDIKNCENISFNNLIIEKFKTRLFSIDNSSFVSIENSELNFGLSFSLTSNESSSNTLIKNNSIMGSSIVGIQMKSRNSILENNKVFDCGLIKQLTSRIFYIGAGIGIIGSGSIVRNNEVFNIGYNPIGVFAGNVLVEKNFITNFGLTAYDGAGIYAIGENVVGSLIQENIIIGDPNSPEMNGIYTDDKSIGVTIRKNSISGTYYGIYMHNNKRVKVIENKIFKTKSNGILIQEDQLGFSSSSGGHVVDNLIENNEIFLLNSEKEVLRIRGVWSHYDFGKYNNNKFFNPYSFFPISLKTSELDKKFDIADWNLFSGQDPNSKQNLFVWKDYDLKTELSVVIDEDFNNYDNTFYGQGTSLKLIEKANGDSYIHVQSESRTGIIKSPNFSIKRGEEYVLEFDAQSMRKGSHEVFFRQWGSPYVYAKIIPIQIDSTWRTYQYSFKADQDIKDMSVLISCSNKVDNININNFKLRKVELKEPSERSKFLINKERNTKSFSLDNNIWEDLSGNLYSKSVLIQPFESKILFLSNSNVISLNANAGPDTSICAGESTTLTASGGSIYTWNTGETTQSISVSPENTSTYSVTVSDGNSSATDEVTVTVNEILANAGPDKAITQGDSVSLTATGGDSYVWSTGETTETITVNPNSVTTYSVTVKTGSCEDTDTVNVNVTPSTESINVVANAGEDRTICLGDKITLNASGGDTYVWNTGDEVSQISVSPVRTTTYSVQAAIGGIKDTDAITITVENCNSEITSEDFIPIDNFTVYPNPTDGILHIEASHSKQNYSLIINDYKGSIIYTDNINASNSNNLSKEIDLSRYVQGVYFVRLINSQEQLIKKIVLM